MVSPEKAQEIATLKEAFLSKLGDLSEVRRGIAEYVVTMAGFIGDRIPAEHNVYRRILRDGRFFSPQPLPKRYAYGEVGYCFDNAAHLALSDENLTYCEGIAIGVIPTLHAWCVDPKGRVIDPTWRTRANDPDPERHNPGEMAYLGVTFTDDEVRVNLLKRGHHGFFAGRH